MRYSGRTWMSFGLAVLAAWVVITALEWPLKTALFPVIIGIPVFFMAMGAFFLSLFWKEESDEETSEAHIKLSKEDQALAKWRTISISLWILGFFLLIIFVGFPIAVPLLVFLYLRIDGKERWGTSLGLAAVAWGFFFGLFEYICHIPFIEGWVQKWLRSFGVL